MTHRMPAASTAWLAAVLAVPCAVQAAAPSPEVRIQRFEIEGASAVPQAELQSVLAPWLERVARPDELTLAARAIERKYLADYRMVARVTLPPQDITDGVVRLRVAEARLGKVVVQGDPVRSIPAERAIAMVEAAQPRQQLLRIDAIERATGWLADWPGLGVQSSLVAGAQPGETDIALTLQDRRPWDLALRLDNEGARATGRARALVDGSLVLPGGGGQTLSANALLTEGSRLLKLGGATPLNDSGWRASVYGSALEYRLVTPEFNSLDVKGPSNTLGASVSWAAARGPGGGTDVSAQVERRDFNNQALGTTLSKYKIDALTVRLGQQRNEPFGRMRTSYDISASAGRVDLGGSPNEASDAQTSDTAGSYAVVRASLQHWQAVSASQSWNLRLSAQAGSKNLDVSERLPIAGPGGVRGYPVGEATGSRGLLASAEWQQNLGNWARADTTVAAFADLGVVDQLIDTDFAGAPTKNRIRLSAAGFWLEWRPVGTAVVARLAAAHPIGSHPNPTPAGTNQDGSRIGTQWWASAQWFL